MFPTPLPQELFKHLPNQRKLSAKTKAKASSLLQMNANKKMIQTQLSQETGKVILLKDLTNIATAAKQGHSRNSVDAGVHNLMEKYGKCVRCFVHDFFVGGMTCHCYEVSM